MARPESNIGFSKKIISQFDEETEEKLQLKSCSLEVISGPHDKESSKKRRSKSEPNLDRMCSWYAEKNPQIVLLMGPDIGHGQFSDISLGKLFKKPGQVAVKSENFLDDNCPFMLSKEYKTYMQLGEHEGLAKVFLCGSSEDMNLLIMQLLGPSLEAVLKICRGKFSTKTVCMIGIQMLHILKHIHKKNVVHRDIKPDNILIGRKGPETAKIFLIDFGLAAPYMDPITKEHRTQEYRNYYYGTAAYMSINAHEGLNPTRGDDIESLGYLLIHLFAGKLPWGITNVICDRKQFKTILQKKRDMSISELCDGCPRPFREFFEYIRCMGFFHRPNYMFLENVLKNILRAQRTENDGKFDWMNHLDKLEDFEDADIFRGKHITVFSRKNKIEEEGEDKTK